MKLLVSDFDNTLFSKDYTKNVLSVNEFVEQGNMFVIATGRHLPYLLKDIKSIELKYKYLICNDGAIIYDKNLLCIYRKDIDNALAKSIIDLATPYIGTVINDWLIDDSQIYTKNLDGNINAIVLNIKDRQKSIQLLDIIKNKYNEIDGYISDNWINIRHCDVTKATAIKLVSEIEKINNENIFAIGDSINDIPMLNEYNGYCISNSNLNSTYTCKNIINSVSDLVDKIK